MDKCKTEIKIEITDHHVMLNLHKALLEARFHQNPDNPEVAFSPIVADFCNELVDHLARADGENDAKKAGSWNHWRKLENQPHYRERALSNALLNNRWTKMGEEEKRKAVKNLLSPFQATEEEIDRFIREVDDRRGTEWEYTDRKANLQRLLTGARMTDVCYGETFYLLFTQDFCNGVNTADQCREMHFQFVMDAPCWFGDRDEWLERVRAFGNGKDLQESEDCLLACELTRLRYWNLINVEKVEFLEDHLAITFPQGNVLSVPYGGDADYEWYLEAID